MADSSLADWRNQRLYAGLDKAESNRTPGQRDRDRILYSPAFRRLQAVTQVILAADEGYLQHNRLTHSLKVGQIGRRIAELLERTYKSTRDRRAIERRGGLDPDVVEAASLAHDLGHPPFGHIAEERLQELIEAAGLTDSFEGNAQSFRIVARLSIIDEKFVGLDLTRASLNAILKYPWMREGLEPKWGAYETEEATFAWARDGRFGERERSLEADIMDWADDIAYAIHDVEDFFRVGLIPLGALRDRTHAMLPMIIERVASKLNEEKDTNRRVAATTDDVWTAYGQTIEPFVLETYDERQPQRAALNQYTSALIGEYVTSTGLTRDARLEISAAHLTQIALLKELTKVFVVEAPGLATQQEGQRRIIRDLYRSYVGALRRGRASKRSDAGRLAAALFPTRVADEVETHVGRNPIGSDGVASAALRDEACRLVADTIAGMTETQALRIHHRLLGLEFGALVDPAVS